MATSLVRGHYVICRTLDRQRAEVPENAAVFQRGGLIVELGPWTQLAAKRRPDEVLGSDHHLVVPGFVNGRHRVGLVAFRMGTPDMALEPWMASRIRKRDVDPHLDTLYGTFEMVESGITTIQHRHSRAARPLECIHDRAKKILRAYDAIGMRVPYSFGLRDHAENYCVPLLMHLLDDEVPVVDALVHLARTSGVETIIVAGDPILRDLRFTHIDRAAALEELAASLRVPPRPGELERRTLSKRLPPHVRRFYADEGHLDAPLGPAFRAMSCRH